MLESIGKNWISILSLAVSVFVLYNNYLSKFRLEIRDAGRIQVSKNPFSEGLQQPCLIIDLIFTNQGVRKGIVEDIAISLTDKDKTSIFRSLLIVTDRSKNFQSELIPPKTESFTAFGLGKEESIVKQIMLVPTDSSQSSPFTISTYHADIWAFSSEYKDWVKYRSVTFNISEDDVKALNMSTVTPQPNGGYFVKWVTQDKPLQGSETRLIALKNKIIAK